MLISVSSATSVPKFRIDDESTILGNVGIKAVVSLLVRHRDDRSAKLSGGHRIS